MNTKELTRNTRHAIEDMLASQNRSVTPTISRYINEILHDHNTAYKTTLIATIESVAVEVLHINNLYWTDATVTALLRGIINRIHYL